MDDDDILLNRFTHEHSEAAFETLARRYLDLVYSAALRQTTDAAMAEDVTQAVFITLAQKAPSLRSDTILSAWLLSTTRLAASNARRIAANRRHFETKAALMNTARLSSDAPGSSSPDWSAVAPHLDEALADLPEADRAAVALRSLTNSRSPLSVNAWAFRKTPPRSASPGRSKSCGAFSRSAASAFRPSRSRRCSPTMPSTLRPRHWRQGLRLR